MALVAAAAKALVSPASVSQSFLGSPVAAKPIVSVASPRRSVTCAAVASRPTAGSSSGYAKLLEGKTIGELRQMAREKGLRGDTKKELIQLLLVASGAAAPPSPRGRSLSPAPAARSALLSGSSDAQVDKLLALSMGELRTMARAKGIRGDTKGEIVKELLGLASVPKAGGSRSRSVSPAPRASSPVSSFSSGGVSEARRKALDSKTMGELRAMARERGLRGDTKKELINLLL